MAAGAACKMRMYLSDDNPLQFSEDCQVDYLLHRKMCSQIALFKIEYQGAFSNGFAEISAPNAVFDGTTTAATVFVDSTDAKDASDGAAVRTVRILGLDANGFAYEDVALTGTTGKETTTEWVRLFHFYATSWGAETDAAGTITVQDDATGTTKYLTIAAGANESDGAALFFLDANWMVKVRNQLDVYTSTTVQDSVMVRADFASFDGNNDADFDVEYWRAAVSADSPSPTCREWRQSGADAKITFAESYFGGGAENGHALISVVCGNTSTILEV